MTRALFVHSGNMYGGVERVLETLARSRRLCPDLEPRFALCFDGRLAETLRAIGTPPDMLGRVRLTRPDLLLRARARLAAVLRHRPADVVITQGAWSHAIFAPVARRFGIPLVMWVHDELSGKPWLEKLAARHPPDLLICNSRYSQRAAQTIFPAVPATAIYCPLIFDDAFKARREVRHHYATADAAIVIVNVARMEPYKGHHVLIDALGQLEKDRPWVCWIVGGAQRRSEEQYERSLHEAAIARGLQERVTFLGQQSDVRSLLGAADLFCHPNQGAEPFGLSIVEALGAGLPVIASGLGGPEEILTASCGRLVPAGNAGALAEALSSLLADAPMRHRMAQSGPARALELCDAGARLTDLSNALERIRLQVAA